MKKLTTAQRVGCAIRDARKAMALSQDEFADRIGMHRAYFSAIERGEKNITLATLRRVAQGLDATMASLVDGAD